MPPILLLFFFSNFAEEMSFSFMLFHLALCLKVSKTTKITRNCFLFVFPLCYSLLIKIRGKMTSVVNAFFFFQINNSNAVHSQIHQAGCFGSSLGLLSSGQAQYLAAQSLCSLFHMLSDLSRREGQTVSLTTGEHLWAERLTSS